MQDIERRVIRYRCEICECVFEKLEPKVLECRVIHLAGQCCHYGEKLIEEAHVEATKT